MGAAVLRVAWTAFLFLAAAEELEPMSEEDLKEMFALSLDPVCGVLVESRFLTVTRFRG